MNKITDLPGLTFHQEMFKYTLLIFIIAGLFFIVYTFYKMFRENKKERNFEIRRKI